MRKAISKCLGIVARRDGGKAGEDQAETADVPTTSTSTSTAVEGGWFLA